MHKFSWEIPKKQEKFELINTLSESRAFRNESSLDKLNYEELAGVFYLYQVALLLLSLEDHSTAARYARRTSAFNNFKFFRVSVTDLYLMAYVMLGHSEKYKDQDKLKSKSRLSELDFKRFLSMVSSSADGLNFMESYFYGLERQTRMTNGVFRNLRRNVINWNELNKDKKEETVKKIMYYIKSEISSAEILSDLRKIR